MSNNTVEAAALLALIQEVYRALSGPKSGVIEANAPEKPVPAVPIKKSVYPDYIVCLEDGKMLKRHLQSSYNITPDQYPERWGLPRDYRWSHPPTPNGAVISLRRSGSDAK